MLTDIVLGDGKELIGAFATRYEFEHCLLQHTLQDRTQATRTRPIANSNSGYQVQCLRSKLQIYLVHGKQRLKLPHNRIVRFGEDTHKIRFLQAIDMRDDRKTTDELRNQTKTA